MLTGRITSPNYPNNYGPDLYCEYLVRTEPAHTLILTFVDFDLEHTVDCTDDFVRVYDGAEKRDDRVLLNNTCLPPNNTVVSRSNELLLIMKSDHHIDAKGFRAEFETSCGSKINATRSGFIEVGHNLRWATRVCEWTITAPVPGGPLFPGH